MKIIFGLVIASPLIIILVRRILTQKKAKDQALHYRFLDVQALLVHPELKKNVSLGTQRMDGLYGGQPVQIQTITDTLATRKLPSLWLMVTLPATLAVTARLDMMLRPAGPTSFSNFDFLNHAIHKPEGFPKDAVLRSDAEAGFADLTIVAKHLSFFENPHAKELLITPNGLRIVIQLAEAERARYVVLREANFTDVQIDADLVKSMIKSMLALKTALEENPKS